MSSIDPLDAPLHASTINTTPKKYICSPRQIKLFLRGIVVLLPLNTVLWLWLVANRFAWGELTLVGMIQGGFAVALLFVIGLNALFIYKHLPYYTRVWQLLVLYYLSLQVVMTLLFVVFFLLFYFF